jgi:hypothetical protein
MARLGGSTEKENLRRCRSMSETDAGRQMAHGAARCPECKRQLTFGVKDGIAKRGGRGYA